MSLDEIDDFRDFRFGKPNTGIRTAVVQPQVIAIYDGRTGKMNYTRSKLRGINYKSTIPRQAARN